MNSCEAIEYFHLMFCHQLSAKLDKRFFCLKGGCNLRFFFQSIRYSEDIDFDVQTTSVETLKKNVEKILKDKTFRALLKTSQGLEIVEWSAPKQTETTQRWKVSLRIGSHSLLLPTKIEFSRRSSDISGGEIEPVNPNLISKYKLQIVLLSHYQLSTAIEQKLRALIGRNETQVRDVIDLQMLKNQIQGKISFPQKQRDKEKAIEALMSISYEDYKSQVWPYLMPEYQEHYGRRAVWVQLQDEVLKFIEAQPERLREQS